MSGFWKIVAVLACTLAFSTVCSAQGKVYTVKARMADFYSRTTKVVLSSDQMLDLVLSDAVRTRWRVSPYEFCTEEEYESLRTNPSYYFLRVVYKDSEPGLVFLSLSKGGKTSRNTDIDSAFDVLLIPFDRVDFSTGKLSCILPLFVDIVQTYAEDARVMEGRSFVGLTRYNKNIIGNRYSEMLVSDCDLNESVSILPPGIIECPFDDVERAFAESRPCLVGITVCTEFPQTGAKNYLFVVTADTNELYFFRTRPFDTYGSYGFTGMDLSMISKFLRDDDR